VTDTQPTPAPNTGLQSLFGGVTKDAAAAAAKAVANRNRNYFKLEDGINVVRLLPPPPGQTEPWVMGYEHFFRNWSGGDKHFSFGCPRENGGGRCPACEEADRLNATGNPVDAKRAKDYNAKLRVYSYIVDRKNPEAGIQVMAYGSMILEQMVELLQDEDVYGQDFTHPFEGDDLAIKKFEKDGYVKYRVNIRNGNHDRLAETDEQMVEWLQGALRAPLSQKLKTLSYEEIVQKGNELTAEARGHTVQSAPAPAPAARPAPAPAALPPAAAPASGLADGGFQSQTVDADLADSAGQTANTPF